MLQDFAKIRPEPLQEKRPAATPPAWSLLFTGMLTGLAVGVFGCVLFYLSGNVPPLQPVPQTVQTETTAPSPDAAVNEPAPAADNLRLEFYDALPDYEVKVNVTPVEIPATVEIAAEAAATGSPDVGTGLYMLQIGAFERRANADSLRARIEALQLTALVKEEPRTGRVLYLVQSGPYGNRADMIRAENTLKSSNISSTRISLALP